MKSILVASIVCFLSITACTQTVKNGSKSVPDKIVGGVCEDCDAVLEYGDKFLNNTDTLPDFGEPGPKLRLSGTIYHRDGKTPAKDVILYIYHTDQKGEYSGKGSETGWGRRHGYIRGWIKTDADGKYSFYTLRPAPYPGGGNPAHIHPIVKEPGISPYWIDEYLFEGDTYLTDAVRQSLRNRGGIGLLNFAKGPDGLLIAKRDIVLGLNVPGY